MGCRLHKLKIALGSSQNLPGFQDITLIYSSFASCHGISVTSDLVQAMMLWKFKQSHFPLKMKNLQPVKARENC